MYLIVIVLGVMNLFAEIAAAGLACNVYGALDEMWSAKWIWNGRFSMSILFTIENHWSL